MSRPVISRRVIGAGADLRRYILETWLKIKAGY
jgi:hypothetical protein